MMFDRVQQQLESPPSANTWSYHGIDSPMQSLCHRPCVGVETKARSQPESLCSFCPCEFSFSSLRGQKGECHLTFIVQCSKMYTRQICYLCPGHAGQGHLGLHITRARENSWGLGCFLDTTELDEKCTFHYSFGLCFPLQFLPGISFPQTSFSRGGQSSVQEVNCFSLSDVFRQTFCAFIFKCFSMFISGKDFRRLVENCIMDFRNHPIFCKTNSVALPALLNQWRLSISFQCSYVLTEDSSCCAGFREVGVIMLSIHHNLLLLKIYIPPKSFLVAYVQTQSGIKSVQSQTGFAECPRVEQCNDASQLWT